MNVNANDSEVDLTELLKDFWRERLFIFSLTLVSLVGGLIYIAAVPPSFRVTSQAVINFYDPFYEQVCFEDINCLDEKSFESFGRIVGSNWKVSESGLVSLITKSPLDLELYYDSLLDAVKIENERISKSAKFELTLIQEITNPQILSSEEIANRTLSAAGVLKKLNSNVDVISITQPKLVKVSPRILFVLFLTTSIGFFSGFCFVVIRKSFK
jgi:LPS O-antigen subunit length determinant protein (WzzB/FepE family)